MLVVVTGLSGVGKSEIMSKSNIAIKQINLDAWVKKNLYKKWQKGYRLIKKQFGKQSVSFWKVNTKMLSRIIQADISFLNELNALISPLIKKYLQKLLDSNKNFVIEQATYINHELDFKQYYSKVILIQRSENKRKSKNNFLKNREIKSTYVIINDGDVNVAIEEYQKIIKNIFSNII